MQFLALLLVLLIPVNAWAAAEDGCTLVTDFRTTEIIHESGNCRARHAPESTFKIPLALMGFDSGMLQDAHNPVWPYEASYKSSRKEERAPTDPKRWEKDSVVWFSQRLTTEMGMEKFQRYVDLFQYGNKDLSGDAGKHNGLTHAWLSSSLQISPAEQIGFIRSLLNRKFDLYPLAYDKTLSIIPSFTAGEWTVRGKTGSGFARNQDGSLNRSRQRGWFVGWAELNGRKVVFAKFIADSEKQADYAGPRARDAFLKELPDIMARDRQNQH